MQKSYTVSIEHNLKMVKNKRDLKSPRRSRSFTGSRQATRARLTSSTVGGNIRVVVRVRPPNDRERGDNFSTVIKVVDENTMVFDPKEEDEPFFYHGVQQRNRDIMKKPNKHLHFTFDRVFGHDANNCEVFENSTKGLIQTLMNGYNCSVFVYGATGAGKTHTMLGRGDDPGITFLTMRELFQQKEALSEERDFEMGMTYLEVYNETVQDLLHPGIALQLREDGKYGVIVAGIQVQRIQESEKLFELLEQGNRNRTQHPTDANAESSRSHAVFQVYLRMKFRLTEEVRVAKLSMIDLAGSERGAATGYTGARFTEGANINKSLLALGNCINSLADGQRHVPYRDSKLTRLLKDSLGGNCQTFMIANVSPCSLSYEDTYNTLKYAMRAKKIKSNMKKNVINCERNVNHYIKLVDDLTKENEQLKLKLSLTSQNTCNSKETITKEEPDTKLQAELQALYAEKRQLKERVLQLESAECLFSLRKQLKEESDARLSGICSDTPEKEHGHRRLGSAVDRLERQAANVQKELATLHERNEYMKIRVQEFLLKAPHLQSLAEMENAHLACLKANNKAEHLQKVCDLQGGELRMRDQLIEKFSEVLKPCFMQLRGHGYATESLIASYQGLVRHLQGIRSVSWDDTATTSESELQEPRTANKRKLAGDALMDSTFVLSEDKIQRSPGEPLMAKVYKPSPNKTIEVNSRDQTCVLSANTQQTHSVKNFTLKLHDSSSPEEIEAVEAKSLNQTRVLQNKKEIVSDNHLITKVYELPPQGTTDITSVNHTRVLSQTKHEIISAKHLMIKLYKASPEESDETTALNHTRVLSQNKQQNVPLKYSTSKVQKTIAGKKQVKLTGASPYRVKENKAPFQARPVPITNSARILNQDKTRSVKTLKPRATSAVRSVMGINKK